MTDPEDARKWGGPRNRGGFVRGGAVAPSAGRDDRGVRREKSPGGARGAESCLVLRFFLAALQRRRGRRARRVAWEAEAQADGQTFRALCRRACRQDGRLSPGVVLLAAASDADVPHARGAHDGWHLVRAREPVQHRHRLAGHHGEVPGAEGGRRGGEAGPGVWCAGRIEESRRGQARAEEGDPGRRGRRGLGGRTPTTCRCVTHVLPRATGLAARVEFPVLRQVQSQLPLPDVLAVRASEEGRGRGGAREGKRGGADPPPRRGQGDTFSTPRRRPACTDACSV